MTSPTSNELDKQDTKQQPRPTHHKLAKLPKNARVEKRPLFRPPIPSKNASKAHPKVVYISQRTPFVSAVKRVRKLLALADRRAVQARTEHVARGDPRRVEKMAAVAVRPGDEEAEEVWVKGAGRSVQRALQIAVFLQGLGDLRVRLRTGSVWAVDDVVLEEEEDAGAGGEEGGKGEEENEIEENEVPETRKRRISVLEVGVSLK